MQQMTFEDLTTYELIDLGHAVYRDVSSLEVEGKRTWVEYHYPVQGKHLAVLVRIINEEVNE